MLKTSPLLEQSSVEIRVYIELVEMLIYLWIKVRPVLIS